MKKNKMSKQELGEAIIHQLLIDFMNKIIKAEESTDNKIYFDNLKIEADLKDGRTLSLSLMANKGEK